jgi:hypothetical protein
MSHSPLPSAESSSVGRPPSTGAPHLREVSGLYAAAIHAASVPENRASWLARAAAVSWRTLETPVTARVPVSGCSSVANADAPYGQITPPIHAALDDDPTIVSVAPNRGAQTQNGSNRAMDDRFCLATVRLHSSGRSCRAKIMVSRGYLNTLEFVSAPRRRPSPRRARRGPLCRPFQPARLKHHGSDQKRNHSRPDQDCPTRWQREESKPNAAR